jgi:hypothetical protein
MCGPHIEGFPARLDHATVPESGPPAGRPRAPRAAAAPHRDLKALVPTTPQPTCGDDYAVIAGAAISVTTASDGGTAKAEIGAASSSDLSRLRVVRQCLGASSR